MFIDMTKGIQYLNETMELVLDGWREALRGGPLADELVQNLKVRLVDVKLHEDAIHRGPAQVIPAVRSAVKAGILMAGDSLLSLSRRSRSRSRASRWARRPHRSRAGAVRSSIC